jgi:hypothetical protein
MKAFQFINSLGTNPQFASIVVDTEAKLIKPKTVNSKFIGLRKISYKSILLNFIYENSVRNQMVREGIDPESLVTKERTNGLVYYPNSKCLMHNADQTKDYIWFKLEKSLETKYFLNGIEVDKKDLVGVLYIPSSSSTQSQIEKKIIVNNLLLSNLVAITANGITYYNK